MNEWLSLLPQAGQGSGIPEFALQALNAQSNRAQNDAQTQALQQQTQQQGVTFQQKANQERQYQADVATMLATTDPRKQAAAISNLIYKYPDRAKEISQGFSVQNADAQRTNLGHFGEVVAAIDAGKPELAATSIERRIAADKAAGLDTSAEEEWLPLIRSGDKKAIAYVRGAMLAHIGAVDPERFSQNYATAAKPGEGYDLSPGAQRRNAQNEIVASAPFAPRLVPVRRADGGVDYREYQPGEGTVAGAPPAAAPAGPRASSADLFRVAQDIIPGTRLNSGQRSAEHNREVGGVPNSQHIAGTAIDIPIPQGITPQQLKQQYADRGMAVDVIPEPDKNHWHIQGARQTAPVASQPQAGGRTVFSGAAPVSRSGGGLPDGGGSDDAITNDAYAYIHNGLRLPPGSARNQAYVTSVKNRAAQLMKQQGITPQMAMQMGQDFKGAEVMVKGMANTRPGTAGGITRSLNVGVDHLLQLRNALAALQNGDVQAFNSISNWWQKQTGGALPNDAEALRIIVAGEITKAITGSAGALGDRQGLEAQLSPNMSPSQQRGVVDGYLGMMGAQIRGMRRSYESATGRNDFGRYLSPRTARMAGLQQQSAQSQSPVRVTSPAQAQALKPGTLYVRPDGKVMRR